MLHLKTSGEAISLNVSTTCPSQDRDESNSGVSRSSSSQKSSASKVRLRCPGLGFETGSPVSASMIMTPNAEEKGRRCSNSSQLEQCVITINVLRVGRLPLVHFRGHVDCGADDMLSTKHGYRLAIEAVPHLLHQPKV